MNKQEIKQQLKNTTLNEIRNLYVNPCNSKKHGYDSSMYAPSYNTQREERIEYLINQLEFDLKEVDEKFKGDKKL